MFVKEMKPLINYIVDLDIIELECKLGYKGANVVRTSSNNASTIADILDFCEQHNIPTNVRRNYNRVYTDIFCIFEMDDIYKIK